MKTLGQGTQVYWAKECLLGGTTVDSENSLPGNQGTKECLLGGSTVGSVNSWSGNQGTKECLLGGSTVGSENSWSGNQGTNIPWNASLAREARRLENANADLGPSGRLSISRKFGVKKVKYTSITLVVNILVL